MNAEQCFLMGFILYSKKNVKFQLLRLKCWHIFDFFIINQQMSKASTVVSLFLLICFLGGVHCMQWQAAANISAANHTLIWAMIQGGFNTYIPNAGSTSTNHTLMAGVISSNLNSAYDPAWNVFVFELVGDPTVDAIVIAYAFRDHWMWYNGYSYLGRTFSFVIWKDYNCVTWNAVDDSVINGAPSQTMFGMVVSSALNAITIVDPYNDMWTFG
jgi:hypothetical protein